MVDAAAEHGSNLTNVVPHGTLSRSGSAWKSEVYVVRTAGDRRRLVRRLADGFVVLPGGLDTLGDLGELALDERPAKPIVLVNQCGYFDALLTLLDHAVAESFVTPVERRLIEVAYTADEVLRRLGIPTDVVRTPPPCAGPLCAGRPTLCLLCTREPGRRV
jgi:predicted Rossmann-fold nucleotide-binding protein